MVWEQNDKSKCQNKTWASTPLFKRIGLVRAGSKLHLKPQYVTDIQDSSAQNHTASLLEPFVQLYLWSLMIILVHMLPVTVHKLRQSALACNQCVMLLLALPLNKQAGICPTR